MAAGNLHHDQMPSRACPPSREITMRYTPPAQKFATLRPCLEVLEDRWCPSATATLSPDGHTLVIKGDANANTVSIVQDDANDALVVDCDGTISNFTSSQV